MMEDAGDVGLLLLDKHRREVRFEGDKERWRVPARAITECSIEVLVQGYTRRYFVVLRASGPNGLWEAPVRERRGSLLLAWTQKKITRRLFDSIQEMRGVGTPAT